MLLWYKYFLSFIVKNIIHERTHSSISKMCETIKEVYKLNSENLAVLQTNQKQLEKIYYEAIVSHLKSIEVITLILIFF